MKFLLFLLVLTFLPLTSAIELEKGTIIQNICLGDSYEIIENSTLDSLTVNSTCEGDINNITAFYSPILLAINNTNSTSGTISLFNLNDDVIVFDNGTRIYSSGVNDSINITLNSGQYIYVYGDGVSPTITVNNPKSGIDEKTQPINFVVTLDENGTCEYSLDGNSRQTMTQTNLVFSDSKVLSNGNHDIVFYCNDTLDNSATSSLILFDVYITSEGGNSETVVGVITPITLNKIDIKIKDWFIGVENKIEIHILDKDNNLIDVEVNIEIIENIFHSKEISRINNGKYLGKFFIQNESIKKITLNITASEKGKVITEIKEINLKEPKFENKIINSVKRITSIIKNNQETSLIVLIIVSMIIISSAYLKSTEGKQ